MTDGLLTFHCACPRGVERLLAKELRGLGVENVRPGAAGVAFQGPLEAGYRACLWSRVASRVLLEIARCAAEDGDALYRGALDIPWEQHLDLDNTFAIASSGRDAAITHSQYASLKLKDAIADRMRAHFGRRPNVDAARPDLRIHLHLQKRNARLSIDLSGAALHRRGYRTEAGPAPLKENLAAALLLLADWPRLARQGAAFFDPMCGAGTLVIEAAMMAADVAPGLCRERFGLHGWKQHQAPLWSELLTEAERRREQGLTNLPSIVGQDQDRAAVELAKANLDRAGLAACARFRHAGIDAINSPIARHGLVLTNPPYGRRLSASQGNPRLYRQLGRKLEKHYCGWRIGVFTGDTDLLRQLKLPAGRSHDLYNGALACRLGLYELSGRPSQATRSVKGDDDRCESVNSPQPDAGGLPVNDPQAVKTVRSREGGAQAMLANRLRKNRRHWGRWAARQNIDCYRVYDQDLPEFAVAIDVYGADRLHLLVQEYRPPARVDPDLAEQRLQIAIDTVAEVFEVEPGQVHIKRRQRQRGSSQYQRLDRQAQFLTVQEGGHSFLVNLTDYLDSGLFLDHRLTRGLLAKASAGKRFLNLYAYTGSATVYAAAGGARQTTSIDLSATYLDWCRRNLALNGFDATQHELVQADCLAWLQQAASERRYDLIFIDPPTFSNSKRMQGTLDVQRDHLSILQSAARLLSDDGCLYFSTNARRFELDAGVRERWRVEDLSQATLPDDFRRTPRIHQCWRLSRAAD